MINIKCNICNSRLLFSIKNKLAGYYHCSTYCYLGPKIYDNCKFIMINFNIKNQNYNFELEENYLKIFKITGNRVFVEVETEFNSEIKLENVYEDCENILNKFLKLKAFI